MRGEAKGREGVGAAPLGGHSSERGEEGHLLQKKGGGPYTRVTARTSHITLITHICN